ncbi:MAG: nucleotidyltransferase domain-containing protein [Nanoarchaeota archaeon]|nr:nucleotidyltransferase domain-containing protein [Nanoarchaeota archaeon]
MNLLKSLDRHILGIIEYFTSLDDEITRGKAAKGLKLSKATAVKYFDLLVDNDVLVERKIGNLKLVKLNRNSSMVKEIKKLILLSYLYPVQIGGAEVYLFGSSARGDYNSSSDIDILVIGKLRREDLVEKTEKLEKKTKRKINWQIFTPQEWSVMAGKDKAFYERVEKDKVKLNSD